MNVSMSIVDVSILKSTRPDIEKIVTTLEQFGPAYRYLICGYPPFLKRLVECERIDLSAYDVSAAVGGEGMSESLRDYMLRAFGASTPPSAPPTSRSTSPPRTTSPFSSAASSATVRSSGKPSACQTRLADGLPVQPAGLLHRGQRAGRALDLGLPPWQRVAEDPLQHPRLRTRRPLPELKRALNASGSRPSSLPHAISTCPCCSTTDAPTRRSRSTAPTWGRPTSRRPYSGPRSPGPRLSFALLVGEDAEANKTLCLRLRARPGQERPGQRRGTAGRGPRAPDRGQPGLPGGEPLHPGRLRAVDRVPRPGDRSLRRL